MYAIESNAFGFRLTFSGHTDADELERWLLDCGRLLQSASLRFGVLSDMRAMRTFLPPRCQDLLIRGQGAFRARGLERSAVVASNGSILTQLKMIALTSGIYQCERYLDATALPDWESEALAWVISGREPAMRELRAVRRLP